MLLSNHNKKSKLIHFRGAQKILTTLKRSSLVHKNAWGNWLQNCIFSSKLLNCFLVIKCWKEPLFKGKAKYS